MTRTTRSRAALGLALICGIASAVPAFGQALRVPAAHVVPRPVLDGVPAEGTLRLDLSRDGSRLFSVARDPSDSSVETWRVLDSASGAVIAAGTTAPRLTLLPNAVMSPDGTRVAFVVRTAAGADLRVRELSTATDTVRATGPATLAVESLADSGLLVIADAPDVPPVLVRTNGTRVPLPNPCPPVEGQTIDVAATPAALTGDGTHVVYRRYRSAPPFGRTPSPAFGYDLVVADVVTLVARCVNRQAGFDIESRTPIFASGDAGTLAVAVPSGAVVVQTTEGRASPLTTGRASVYLGGLSDDARHVLLTDQPSRLGLSQLVLLQPRTGIAEVLADGLPRAALLAPDGRTVVFWMADTTHAIRAFVATLDADADGISDAWERTFGLDPSTPADATLDADGDGLSNAQEFAAATHPGGTPVRYFAEGADGSFFSTRLSLFNPGAAAVTANLRFLGPEGTTTARPVPLPSRTPVDIHVAGLGLPFTEFSLLVEGSGPIVTERLMAWDRRTTYGSHAGNGVAAPSSAWHFAEGATIAGIQTFFLLQNPGTVPATVTMRYLLAAGTKQERVHVVPAQSRVTVWANQEGAPLDAAEFATLVTASTPIVAERAMYRDASGQVFAAGSASSGIAAPSTTWSFAEGATGAFFDTFLTLANPGDVAATVQVRYRREGTSPQLDEALGRAVVIEPHRRLTIWVDKEDPLLADTAVSTFLTADRPIVAERAMWWPGPTADTWQAAHAEAGVSTRAVRWAMATGEVSGAPRTDTFLLIGSESGFGVQVRVSLHFDDGSVVSRDLAGSDRLTVWMRQTFPEAIGRRFAVIVESLPAMLGPGAPGQTRRFPLAVEAVVYRGDFTTGAALVATPLPDPE